MNVLRVLPRISAKAGTVAIEYGLVLPVMLLFTLGIMDAGRLIWTYTTLSRAAEAGARCGAVNAVACPAAANIQAYAATQAWGVSGITAANFNATKATCGNGLAATNEQVVGTYTFKFFVPWFPQFGPKAPFGSTTLALSVKACYPLNH